jgi:hypothetical protein
MARRTPLQTLSARLALAAAIGLLAAAAAAPVQAARFTPPPEVQFNSEPTMAIDGRSVGVSVLARCPSRWTVVEARVTVTQGSVAGAGSFPLVCDDAWHNERVSVPASGGTFQLADASLVAVLRIARGPKTNGDTESQTAALIPEVVLDAASTARLVDGGQAVLIDIVTGCPVGVIPLDSLSFLSVEQGGRSIGSSPFTFACDGALHTQTLRITTRTNPFVLGPATVTAFAYTEHNGRAFVGVDSSAIEIVAP